MASVSISKRLNIWKWLHSSWKRINESQFTALCIKFFMDSTSVQIFEKKTNNGGKTTRSLNVHNWKWKPNYWFKTGQINSWRKLVPLKCVKPNEINFTNLYAWACGWIPLVVHNKSYFSWYLTIDLLLDSANDARINMENKEKTDFSHGKTIEN